eukprot:scaffold205357_cov15-Tisochrysis_lutea.AAC.1
MSLRIPKAKLISSSLSSKLRMPITRSSAVSASMYGLISTPRRSKMACGGMSQQQGVKSAVPRYIPCGPSSQRSQNAPPFIDTT